MSLGIILAAAVTAVPTAASPPPAESASVATTSGVTVYPVAFFTPYQPTTALDMLGRLPGFTLDTGGGVRGFGGAAGNVLIDGGRPTSKDDSLDEILKRIPASSIVRIELVRGGASGVDMQGKTVLANVVRRRDGKTTGVISVSGTRWYDGRIGRGLRAEISKTIGKTDIEGSLLMARFIDDGAGNGQRTERHGDGSVRDLFDERSTGGGFEYKATGSVESRVWGGKLKVNGSLSTQPYDYRQNDRPQSGPGQDRVEHYTEGRKTAEVGVHFDHALGAKASLETVLLQQLARHPVTDDYSAADDIEHFSIAKSTGESIVRTTVKLQPAKTFSVETGAEGDFNWLNAHTAYTVNGAVIAVPAANIRVTETRGEGFVTAAWSPWTTLSVETGLRVEASKITATGDVGNSRALIYAKPRAVVTWSPNAANQVRVRLEREVDQLNFDDFASGAAALGGGSAHAGNPNLVPAQSWVIEGAFEHRFWGSGDVTVTLRHAAQRDIIDRAPIFTADGVFDAPANIGAGRKDELIVSLTLPTDKLGLARGLITGTSTWRRSRVVDPTTGAARAISGLRPVDAELHFTQGFPQWKTSWGVDVIDQFRETNYRFNEIDTDQIKILVTPFVEYKPRADLTVRLNVENAGGRGVTHSRFIFTGPRNVAPLDFADIRTLHSGRGLYLRLRKTFG